MNAAQLETIDILLVEDNPGDVRLTREILGKAAFPMRINVVDDGERAMEYLHRRGDYADAPRPHLLILDLNLPRRSGMEVLADIKSDDQLRSIPVIVLSSSKSEREISRTYHLHANCYISKPVGLDRYAEIIRLIERFWIGTVHLPIN
jgi:two-component system, chemotaxis family, response regulator Rcp1